MFGKVLILIATVMQAYVFWRASSVPFLSARVGKKTVLLAGVLLWGLFVLGRVYGHGNTGPIAAALEFVGMNWMAVLFLLFVCLLPVEVVTGFGWLWRKTSPRLRGWSLLCGIVLSLIAVVQGMRPPVINAYEVNLKNLPAELDGMVIIAMSDLHLGSILGESWLAARVAQVEAEKPDMVVLLGDIHEGHGRPYQNYVPVFRRLTAPLGVWSVQGNHESHGHGKSGAGLLEEAGFHVLNNAWSELRPGLILAGVDGFSARRHGGPSGQSVSNALSGRPRGTTILLSHVPQRTRAAAELGADLMLCGHTHGGQVWPFNFFVKRRYPLIAGRYQEGDMTVIVNRGTGTWGPRMRLWQPAEILRVTLRSNNLLAQS